jgi:uncharacterized protein (DUF362 family)
MMSPVSRRRFLSLAAAGFTTLALPGRAAPSSASSSAPLARDVVRLGLFPRAAGPLEAGIDAVLDGLDWSWLKRGDRVFVKLASNSAEVHPATTSPTAVRAMVKALRERGAGRIIVGDQGGVASVRLIEGGARVGATRALFARNGLLAAIEDSGAEVHCFEEHGFHDGYVMATLPQVAGVPSSWRRAPFIARVVTEVDHIVALPRISSHLLAGYTHGHKLAVGYLRDDSRHMMHAEADTMYEKYTELNHALELSSRLRLTVSVAERVLVDGGPDGGSIADADPRLVVATSDLAHHDVVTVGLLSWAKANLPVTDRTPGLPFGALASANNAAFVAGLGLATGLPWTSADKPGIAFYEAHDFMAGLQHDRCLQHAYRLRGGAPERIALDVVGDDSAGVVPWLEGRTPARVG